MKRLFFIICLFLAPCMVSAQSVEGVETVASEADNPAPLAPNYERIRKETKRWFGEYRYGSLQRRFQRCDTTMTVDHFRCLYYGAAMRGDTAYTLTVCQQRHALLVRLAGAWAPETQRAWWQLQMVIAAVWSSGDGTAEHPFHVATPGDADFMRTDTGDGSVSTVLSRWGSRRASRR